jgi:hypothetical protein
MPSASQNVTPSGRGGSGIVTPNFLQNGLLELTALTTIIGSSVAEELAFGNRGAVGLAWVGMSTFGSLYIARACVAASMPCWLRVTLGLRNAATDAAIGMSLDLSSGYMDREDMLRKKLSKAIGLTCERKQSVSGGYAVINACNLCPR